MRDVLLLERRCRMAVAMAMTMPPLPRLNPRWLQLARRPRRKLQRERRKKRKRLRKSKPRSNSNVEENNMARMMICRTRMRLPEQSSKRAWHLCLVRWRIASYARRDLVLQPTAELAQMVDYSVPSARRSSARKRVLPRRRERLQLDEHEDNYKATSLMASTLVQRIS